LGFHTGLVEKHAYQANPWSWIVMGRPTSFYYQSPEGCGAENCAQEVLALGTPFLWWIGTIAVAVIFGFWIRSLAQKLYEPQLNIIVVGITAGYLPWFFFQERTVFSFYAIVFQPFIILAILYCAYIALIHFKNSRNTYIFIALVGAVIFLNFIYFLPIFIADVITYEAWRARMWLPSWI
jgi:dolichyl-phosphate-mannose--protein O-mannosyl transferase